MAAQTPPEKIKASQPTIVKSPRETRGYVSAQGVLAELETIEPALRKHQAEAAQKLAQTLTEKVKTILPTLTRTRFDDATLTRIASEVAQESATDILENIPKIQDFAQTPLVIADSLTQSIIAHSELEGRLKKSEEKIFRELIKNKQVQEVVTTHQQDLSKAAVLGQIVNIARLAKPNEQTRSLIELAADHTDELLDPLASPEARQEHRDNAHRFLKNYVEDFRNRIAPQLSEGNIPNFTNLQQAKSASFNQALTLEKTAVPQGKINPNEATAFPKRIGFILGLDPGQSAITDVTAALQMSRLDRLALGAVASNPSHFYYSALSHDQERLKKSYENYTEQVNRLRNKKTRSYSENKDLQKAQRIQNVLGNAISFRAQKPKLAQNLMTFFRGDPAVSQYTTYNQMAFSGQLPGVFAPSSITSSRLLGKNALGMLSPRFGLGDLWGTLRGGFMAPTKIGMGMTPASLIQNNPITNIARRIRNTAGLALGGLYLLALSLGKAALTGAIIGSLAGMGVGAAFGASILIPLGPIGWAAAPVVIPMTTFTGGLVGGAAGMLIGLGLAAGSATIVSMGVGAGIGGTIGGAIGFNLGVAAGAATMTALIGLCFGSAICAPFAPLLIAVSPTIVAISGAIGAVVGATVGALIGAASGYIFGKYVLNPITNISIGIKNFFTGAAGAGAGAATGVAGFITGLASTVWGGITGAAGATFGFLSGATNFVVGGLSSISVPASMAAIPVVGGMGAIAIGGTIIGIVAATSFFNPEGEALIVAGENQYAKIEKQVTATELNKGPSTFISFENSDLPQTLKFDVKVTAKTDLTNITCADKTTLTKKNLSRQNLPPPAIQPCPSTMATNEPFNLTPFVINATHPDFDDSLVVNIFTFRADNSDGTPIVLSITASVAIGDAPMSCPRDWPTRFGHISQGPQGAASHNAMYLSRGEEAIDIGDGSSQAIDGADALATFEGNVVTVIQADNSPNSFGTQVLIQGTCDGVTFTARWAHLRENSITVDPDDPAKNHVTPGMILGKIDNTGRSDGPHLHYSFLGGLEMQSPQIPSTIDPTCEDGSAKLCEPWWP